MTTLTLTRERAEGMTADERRVIFASSLGTVFEWYDFYLYATLAPFFAALFFPPGNDTAALLSAFATYAAGFLVRPFGALIFGRIGDLVGRKYTFLVTIVVMGGATFAVGLLPTFATIGWLAPILLVTLRLLQGLALGGEYGGAATYVAEHARPNERGYATSFIQTTATLGFFLALLVIGLCPLLHGRQDLRRLGLAHSVPGVADPAGVLGLHPAQAQRIAGLPAHEGRGQGLEGAAHRQLPALSQQQIRAAGAARRHRRPRRGLVHGAVLRPVLPDRSRSSSTTSTAYALIGLSLIIGTPFFIVFGWLSDRIGRLEDHPGRLRDRGAHLLPAVRGIDALRQSGARSVPAEEPDHGLGRPVDLQLPHLRGSVVELHRVRPRPGLPDQVGPVVQDRRARRAATSVGLTIGIDQGRGLGHGEVDGGAQRGGLSGEGRPRARSTSSWPS